ncbi:MAG: cytochrome c oxidase subunit II [Burkholderiaceae bacterium]
MSDSNTPLAYFHTAGPAADPITRLGWGLGIVSVAVVVIIAVLMMLAIFRKHRASPPATEQSLMPLRERAGMRWITVGVGISTVVLFVCAVWTLFTLGAVATPASKPKVMIEVRAYQFWWRVRYLDEHGAVLLTTANEIHIPQGEPVHLKLTSADVIHSFWVPALAGKMDAVPGQTNVTWLQGNELGRYRGQCSEYCGVQHAHMGLYVTVDTPAGYQRWVEAQRQPATSPTSPAGSGAHSFLDKCSGCHAVQGTEAKGALAPDLTHLMSRETIAAGALPNGASELRRWIAHTQDVKPGSAMPEVPLDKAELDAVVAYLTTLH